jgi:hypothetical protein
MGKGMGKSVSNSSKGNGSENYLMVSACSQAAMWCFGHHAEDKVNIATEEKENHRQSVARQSRATNCEPGVASRRGEAKQAKALFSLILAKQEKGFIAPMYFNNYKYVSVI